MIASNEVHTVKHYVTKYSMMINLFDPEKEEDDVKAQRHQTAAMVARQWN